MADDIKDFDTNPQNNTSILGVNIDEGAATADMNNALRAIMAAVARGDFGELPIKVNEILESIEDAGVTVDGLLIKDGVIEALATALLSDQPAETTRDIGPDQTELEDDTLIEWNLEENPSTRVVINASREMGVPTNIKDGHTYILVIEQGGTGNNVVTFPSVFRFGNLGQPVFSELVGSKTVVTCLGDQGALISTWQAGF